MPESSSVLPLFKTLVEIVAQLRGPQGCPWDKEQTQVSLTQYAIEEAYELVEAIENGNQQEVQEELGDFLFQVILQAQVAQDEGKFDLSQVISQLNEKMLRRHPHVFGQSKFANTEEVWKSWDKIKNQEKSEKGKAAKTAIFNSPRGLPALQTSAKIGRKTQTWKFDWQTPDQVVEKITEELNETIEALQSKEIEKIEHEIGDLLFSTAQLARHVGLDPEACLRKANRRFEDRFQKIVDRSGVSKEEFILLSDHKKEQLWALIKGEE